MTPIVTACLRLLQDAPATSFEVATELEIERRYASAILCDLHKRGRVARRPYARRGNQVTYIWLLKESK